MTVLICSICGNLLNSESRTAGKEKWGGIFCTSCKSVYCYSCVNSFSTLDACPKCHGRMVLTNYPLLKEYGILQ